MRREAALVPRFNGGPYGPGDVVEGVILARGVPAVAEVERLPALRRPLAVLLRGRNRWRVEPLHEGPVTEGQEIPFALRLPVDACPNWDDSSTANYGELLWSLVIEADIEAGLDTITTHSIPVAEQNGQWTGPAPSGEQRIKRLVDGWDVDVEPDRWTLRRGEELTVTVRIGKPKSGRPKLEMGVACQAFYVVETKQPGESYRRSTNYIDIFREWPPVDPSLPEQSFTVRVPPDAPFSYDGRAFGFLWMAIAREKRRWFQSDAGRIAYLEVMP